MASEFDFLSKFDYFESIILFPKIKLVPKLFEEIKINFFTNCFESAKGGGHQKIRKWFVKRRNLIFYRNSIFLKVKFYSRKLNEYQKSTFLRIFSNRPYRGRHLSALWINFFTNYFESTRGGASKNEKVICKPSDNIEIWFSIEIRFFFK